VTVWVRRLVLGALIVFGAVLFVRSPDDPTFTPRDANAEVMADLSYARPGLEPHERQLLDVYLPRDRTGPVPAVVWIHGGGWVSGDKSDPMGPSEWTERGIAVVAVNYRLADDDAAIADAVADTHAALDHVFVNAASWGIDPGRVALYGHSAGGHLGVLLAVGDAPVVGAVAAGAPLDLVELLDPDVATMGGLIGEDAVDFTRSALGCVRVDRVCEELAEAMSPTRLPSDATPILVIHGDADRFVAVGQARGFDVAHARSPSVVVRVVPGAGHVFFAEEAFAFLEPLLFA
jgi:acetyl esterase/lipase